MLAAAAVLHQLYSVINLSIDPGDLTVSMVNYAGTNVGPWVALMAVKAVK